MQRTRLIGFIRRATELCCRGELCNGISECDIPIIIGKPSSYKIRRPAIIMPGAVAAATATLLGVPLAFAPEGV